MKLIVSVGLLIVVSVLGRYLIWQHDGKTIHGSVIADGQMAVGAVVRVQTSNDFTLTDSYGRFELEIPADGKTIVTAWLPDYLVGWTEVDADDTDAVITLTRHYTTDNPDYEWFAHQGDVGSLSCSHCMPCYSEWVQDAHSQSATNPRFLSLYNGTSLTGEQGEPTQYRFERSTGINIPLVPSLGQEEVGPGFRLDFPDVGGNCAACHAPGAVARPDGGYHVDTNSISGIDQEGVFCEFCHKVGDVRLDPVTLLPNPSLPGVLSMRLYRPEPDSGEQIFFGNFDDVNRRVTYLPLLTESAFCAACHFGEFWGTVVYNAYGEWLESPYSDPETGKTCQDCHMPPVDYNYFTFPDKGGLIRDSERIFSHKMPGAMDEALLQETADLEINAYREDNHLRVTVRVTNSQAGHHIPTDNPLRNMILVVNATSTDGAILELLEGPVIPECGGVGDPADGYYAGQPGVLYARILADFYSDETPTYAYWRQTYEVSDNRIPALASDETTYVFEIPAASESITIDVQLILRRAFKELMDLKAWDTPDILMERETVVVNMP